MWLASTRDRVASPTRHTEQAPKGAVYVDEDRSKAYRLGRKGGATNRGVSEASDRQWRCPRVEKTRQINQMSSAKPSDNVCTAEPSKSGDEVPIPGGNQRYSQTATDEWRNQTRGEDQREPDGRREVRKVE